VGHSNFRSSRGVIFDNSVYMGVAQPTFKSKKVEQEEAGKPPNGGFGERSRARGP